MKDYNKIIIKLNGNVNVLSKDEELLKLSQEARCLSWLIGFDSISQKILNKIGKTSNKIKEYYKTIKKNHDYGMIVIGSFVFGFDNDTKKTFNATYEFIRKSEIDVIPINILTPCPGTSFFNNLDSQGRIFTKNWDKYTTRDVVFNPINMTVIELYEE